MRAGRPTASHPFPCFRALLGTMLGTEAPDLGILSGLGAVVRGPCDHGARRLRAAYPGARPAARGACGWAAGARARRWHESGRGWLAEFRLRDSPRPTSSRCPCPPPAVDRVGGGGIDMQICITRAAPFRVPDFAAASEPSTPAHMVTNAVVLPPLFCAGHKERPATASRAVAGILGGLVRSRGPCDRGRPDSAMGAYRGPPGTGRP